MNVPAKRAPNRTAGVPVTYKAAFPEYTEGQGACVSDLYMSGLSMEQIAARENMPSVMTLCKWMKEHPEFKKQMDAVRTIRAFMDEDRAVEEALSAPEEDGTAAARLKFDAYKWRAEVGDPQRYGKKTVHEGNASNPIQFIISTGFPPPNEHQTPPMIGPDGLIIKTPIEVEHEPA